MECKWLGHTSGVPDSGCFRNSTWWSCPVHIPVQLRGTTCGHHPAWDMAMAIEWLSLSWFSQDTSPISSAPTIHETAWHEEDLRQCTDSMDEIQCPSDGYAHEVQKPVTPQHRAPHQASILLDGPCHQFGEGLSSAEPGHPISLPAVIETRHTHRRRIHEFFQCYRHLHLPAQDRWVIPLLDYMEQHLWSVTEAGGDVWNGRWTSDLLSTLLGESASKRVDPKGFQRALQWIQQLTRLLQNAQRALYRIRHLELASKEAKSRCAMATASCLRNPRQSRSPPPHAVRPKPARETNIEQANGNYENCATFY
jgi:hypothetical protein